MKRINNLFLLSFVGLNLLSCSTNSNMNINKPSIEEEIISPSIEEEIISPSIEDEIIDETLSEQVSDIIGKEEEITESEQIKEEDNAQVGKEEKYYYFDEKIKIYINPSVQYKNLYASDLGNEGLFIFILLFVEQDNKLSPTKDNKNKLLILFIIHLRHYGIIEWL